jgi:hypothetical protein
MAKEISKIENQYWYDYFDRFDDYDNYDSCGYWCDCWKCCPDFEYDPLYLTTNPGWKIISRYGRGLVRVDKPSLGGRFVDMSSIYSREMLREKKINSILGIDADPVKPTFADIFKNIDSK